MKVERTLARMEVILTRPKLEKMLTCGIRSTYSYCIYLFVFSQREHTLLFENCQCGVV